MPDFPLFVLHCHSLGLYVENQGRALDYEAIASVVQLLDVDFKRCGTMEYHISELGVNDLNPLKFEGVDLLDCTVSIPLLNHFQEVCETFNALTNRVCECAISFGKGVVFLCLAGVCS